MGYIDILIPLCIQRDVLMAISSQCELIPPHVPYMETQ